MKSSQLLAFAAYALVFSSFISLVPAPSAGEATKAATPVKQPAHQSAASAALPVLAYLEKRDQTITIKSGPGGLVYSVTSKDGKVLHRDLSESELQAKAPELYEFIRTSFASAKARGATIDASVRNPVSHSSR